MKKCDFFVRFLFLFPKPFAEDVTGCQLPYLLLSVLCRFLFHKYLLVSPRTSSVFLFINVFIFLNLRLYLK